MKRLFLVIILLTATSGQAFATAQFPDELIYKGKTYPIFSNPLESYFGTAHPRPEGLFPASCTALWRGYVATWKIEEDALYLVKVVAGTCAADAPEIPLTNIFPGSKGPIRADWFTGTLVVPQGEILMYVHMGYGSVYEKELHIKIDKGRFIRESLIDNSGKPLLDPYQRELEELQKLKNDGSGR
ncbi:MAG: hypothetical protein PHY31_09360 [Smithellaceae bacterium]|nr:hypothetical protein [Smithellaceae bacterium]